MHVVLDSNGVSHHDHNDLDIYVSFLFIHINEHLTTNLFPADPLKLPLGLFQVSLGNSHVLKPTYTVIRHTIILTLIILPLINQYRMTSFEKQKIRRNFYTLIGDMYRG